VTQLIADFRNSVARFPNVPVGAPDTYRPQPSVAK
jgi:hypothetical protein